MSGVKGGAVPEAHAQRARRAYASLTGLAIGDALGEQFFGPPDDARERIRARRLPALVTPGGRLDYSAPTRVEVAPQSEL